MSDFKGTISLNKHLFNLFSMGRKSGYDNAKINAIISVLIQNSEGIWIRQIAREVKISPATVSKYLNGILKPLIEESSLGPAGKPMLKVIRLKAYVLERIEEGRSLTEIMKMLEIFNKIDDY